ncbi:MAG TPA: AAA family ATPase [Candidatus Limnocylindrales bacterium]|nr:AAA family ATPase [Candidatus Limnocylindrales bacterium]
MAVIGRETELGLLRAAVAELAGAASIAAVVEGPAGIGKSTLWEAAIGDAREHGCLVLTARPAASESQLTLAVLADVFGAVDDKMIAGLPAPQRRALDAALLRDDDVSAGPPPEGRVLGTAVRNLLAALAAARPVVVAIDDVQWADRSSAAALAYAVRRLDGFGVGLLLARRTPMPMPFEPAELMPADRWRRVPVGPMALGTINELLRRHGRSTPSRATLVRIEQASGGNPLFALEIARVLEATGEPPAGEPLPVPADVDELLRDRLAGLTADTRRLLAALAILGSATVERLAAIVDRDVRPELARVEADGLVRRSGESVDFAHPLYASAALAAVGTDERRTAHRRIADTAATPEERARHRALAAPGPDGAIAADLDLVAAEARRRAAPLAAADLLRLAIDRTPRDEREAAARRRLALGEELQRAGDSAAAVRELEEVVASAERITRARARLQLAGIRYETDASSEAAVRLASDALVDAAGDPGLEAHAYAVLAAVDWDNLANHDRYVAEGEARLAMVERPDPIVEGMLLGVACGADFRNARPLDPARIERALELERRAPAPVVADRFSASLGTWLKVLDRFDEARTWLERTRQTALDEGDEGSLPYALAHLPELELWTGHWDRAEAIAREHLAVAEAMGLESQRHQALYNLAMVHAHQGADEARREIEEAAAAFDAAGDDWMLSGVLPQLGVLELSLGEAAAAVAPLERAREMRNRLGMTAPHRAMPDLVEALAATGATDRAAEIQADLDRRLEIFERPSLRAAAARSRGLLLAAQGRVEAARQALDEAMALHAETTIEFDRARTLLALGQVRRRLRERGAARDAFEEARAIFDRLGARRWAERAAAEADRTGLRRGAGLGLTKTERRVAQLAAAGMTNREVAAALFISPKTVDANLGRVYGKLGIRSRAELGAAVARGADATAATEAADTREATEAADAEGSLAQT